MHTPPGENEYISVNVSLFVIYIIYTYIPDPTPQPPATTSPLVMQIERVEGGSPPKFHFTILIAFSFKSSTQFGPSAIRQYNLCRSDYYRRDSVKGYTYSYTLCREIKHPNAAVHCLQQTYRRTQKQHLILQLCYMQVM